MKNIIIAILLIVCAIFPPLAANATNSVSQKNLENIFALNSEMFTTLSQQEQLYQQKLLDQHPIIVALFSPSGGEFILYRPGQTPTLAKPLTEALDYQIATVIEHAAMETYALAIQGLNNPNGSNWQNQMKAYQEKLKLAEQSIDSLTVSHRQKEWYRSILKLANSFITDNLRHGSLSKPYTDDYAKKLEPYFVNVSKVVISNQVNHWINVIVDWKMLLGKDWGNTYGVVMYINAKPKNNIFLHILTHAMGPEAVGNRLFSFTTDSYTPNANQALILLAKATPDKSLAENVFGKYYLSYSQILGKTAREIMGEKETQK